MSTNGRITLFVTIITVDNNSIHVVVMSLSCCKHHGGYKKHFKTIIKTADPLNHQLFFLFNSIWQHYSTVIIDFRHKSKINHIMESQHKLWGHCLQLNTNLCFAPHLFLVCFKNISVANKASVELQLKPRVQLS